MSDSNNAISEREYYRIGRLLLDGADTDWFADREQITPTQVKAAWEHCRERLSFYFAAADGDESVLLDDTQLFARAEECVRLLLHWYEVLGAREQWAEAEAHAPSSADAADNKEAQ